MPFDFAQGREPVEGQMMLCWWIRDTEEACIPPTIGVQDRSKVNPFL
jgi:hypothetical protein